MAVLGTQVFVVEKHEFSIIISTSAQMRNKTLKKTVLMKVAGNSKDYDSCMSLEYMAVNALQLVHGV